MSKERIKCPGCGHVADVPSNPDDEEGIADGHAVNCFVSGQYQLDCVSCGTFLADWKDGVWTVDKPGESMSEKQDVMVPDFELTVECSKCKNRVFIPKDPTEGQDGYTYWTEREDRVAGMHYLACDSCEFTLAQYENGAWCIKGRVVNERKEQDGEVLTPEMVIDCPKCGYKAFVPLDPNSVRTGHTHMTATFRDVPFLACGHCGLVLANWIKDKWLADTEGQFNRQAEDTVPSAFRISVRNLLALIHRDGGQYTDMVGLTRSVVDAQEVVTQLQREPTIRIGKEGPTDEFMDTLAARLGDWTSQQSLAKQVDRFEEKSHVQWSKLVRRMDALEGLMTSTKMATRVEALESKTESPAVNRSELESCVERVDHIEMRLDTLRNTVGTHMTKFAELCGPGDHGGRLARLDGQISYIVDNVARIIGWMSSARTIVGAQESTQHQRSEDLTRFQNRP